MRQHARYDAWLHDNRRKNAHAGRRQSGDGGHSDCLDRHYLQATPANLSFMRLEIRECSLWWATVSAQQAISGPVLMCWTGRRAFPRCKPSFECIGDVDSGAHQHAAAIAVRPSGSAAGHLHRTPSCGWGLCGVQPRYHCLSLSLALAASWPSGAACGCPQARMTQATPSSSRCSTPRGSRWVLHPMPASVP